MTPTHPLASPVPGANADSSMLPLWLRMEREYNLRLQKLGLPINTAITLLKLHLYPEVSEPAALAAASCLPRQTMTFVLDALEQQGLATRRPHLKDRRRKIVQLSVKGRARAAALYQDLVDFEASALRHIGTRQWTTFQRLVSRYTDTLAAENARRSPKGKRGRP